jgi:ribonuclease D
MPEYREALAALDVLPPAVLRRQGDVLLECVAQAKALDEADLPPPAPQPLTREGRSKLQSLKARVRDRAETLGVAPELLLPSADLELLVREAEGEAIAVPPRWDGWRAEAVLRSVRGKAA